tara:strand:- start:5552 stop:6172 length:621 start_codon:yes stop_codon:yes gene_type:complete
MDDNLISFFTLLSCGFLYRLALQISGHEWVKTYNQTFTFVILPFITFVITNVIAGNIALSLGMIGALSIVRFRHPVKSALELVMYFNLITVGIATSVKYQYGIGLILATFILIILLKVIEIIFKKFDMNIFSSSFSDGNELNILELKSTNRNLDLENNINLKSFNFDNDSKEYYYRFAFENSKDLKNFKNKINNDKNISISNFEII